MDITLKDSKYFHVNIFGCKNITFTNFRVSSTTYNPNTDRIHIGKLTQVKITNSQIGTGDDCISLGDGSKEVTILNVTCGPEHGISVGSLEKYSNEDSVEDLIVKNCTLKNTNNGLRIKTWPNIIMINVSNPIIINQEYSHGINAQNSPSKIKISKVTFKNIRGTSATQERITLICSSGVPCETVELSDINLRFNDIILATAKCANVKPNFEGKAPICAT
uniref:Polygalacturonase n=1 Tax=Glycine max TaxID=3847 RepID=A0A0R0L061_SOYBN